MLAWIEADFRHAQSQLKSNPMRPRYLGAVDVVKEQREACKKQLRDLQDPDDQPHNQALRLSRLRAEEEKFRGKLREPCIELAEANASAKALGAKIHARLAEIEQLRSEQGLLALAGMDQNTAAPVDVGQVVKAM